MMFHLKIQSAQEPAENWVAAGRVRGRLHLMNRPLVLMPGLRRCASASVSRDGCVSPLSSVVSVENLFIPIFSPDPDVNSGTPALDVKLIPEASFRQYHQSAPKPPPTFEHGPRQPNGKPIEVIPPQQ